MKKTYSDYTYYNYDNDNSAVTKIDDSFYAVNYNTDINYDAIYPKSLLDQLDVKDIEQYLREKKLQKLKK